MKTKQIGSAGGRKMAVIQRDAALANYYADPNRCQTCGTIISVEDTEKVADVRKRKFCNLSCAALFNEKAKGHSKHFCTCGNQIRKHTKMCEQCRKEINLATLLATTKGELFARRTGYQSARSSIRQHAASVYKKSDKPQHCIACGYDHYYEVCHIRSVASFSDDAMLGEINHIDNLIALCPNHHWEFDRGFNLSLTQIWSKSGSVAS